jgi:hypothetical protein
MVGTNSDPSKFVSTVKFTTPFRFMKQAGRNLIMEVINSSPASVSVGFDAARGTAVQAARLFGLSTTATTGTVAHNYGLIVRFNTQGKGGGPTPVFDVRDMPQINSVLKFELRQANKSSLALLLVGASKKRWGAIPLPFDLTPAGAAGCSLLTSNDLIGVTRTNAMGTASLPLPLPNDRTLIGALFYGQFAVYDGVTNPLGWVFSNGGEILLGGQR